jgi:DNA-binding MarR family transcriptional regulator
MMSTRYFVTMNKTKRTAAGEALSRLILDLFRLNSELLTAGDRLVASLGLTSARWQILGAIVHADRPQPVAWLSRDLGANRQNVQRIINDLHTDGLVAFDANPHHRRAQLVILTDKGRQTFEAAMQLQAPWINSLSDGLTVKDIETFHRVIIGLRHNLKGNDDVPSRRPTRPAAVQKKSLASSVPSRRS